MDGILSEPEQKMGPNVNKTKHPSVPAAIGLVIVLLYGSVRIAAAEPLVQLQSWLGPQLWQRDVDGPILSLGKSGEFDDTHIFAPTVAFDEGRFWMWYCGSSGAAHDLAPQRMPDERVFKLGLATSQDGKEFARSPDCPVFALDEARRSIVTPTLLRNPDGTILREDGKLRLWFSSASLGGGGPPQSVQETSSTDGIHWTKASPVQLERAYAPTVIKSESGYEMWYTQPARYPWLMRHARSDDGSHWKVDEKPVLEITQPWEHFVLIYPTVLKIDDVYLMWYASYLNEDRQTTGIGFAASLDGITWHKHVQNPVLRPDPSRAWESHYVSSQSVMRLPDGSFRMWYASRNEPPFTHLYYALNTARWDGVK